MSRIKPIDVTIIGAGMIVNDLILPSVYQLRREGYVNNIKICCRRYSSIERLKANEEFKSAFPEQDFIGYPSNTSAQKENLYREVLKEMDEYQLVVIAVPDQLHYEIIMEVLEHNQHILCVKPLVLNYTQAIEIEQKSYQHGCFIGIDYHKRFDRRSLLARRFYREGRFGEFICGEARLIEPYYYRNSNFMNWFTADATDPFVYVGCHYVDLVYFITALRPIEVSVAGIRRQFPNGNEAFMWSSGRVRFENDAILSVINGLGYPDDAPGANNQGLTMFFEADGQTGILVHNDYFRGVEYGFTKDEKKFVYMNPDFFKLVPWEGKGLKPVGYGYDSVASVVKSAYEIEKTVTESNEQDKLSIRQKQIKIINETGIIATPTNSKINELVHQAARESILNNGVPVKIDEIIDA